MEYEKDGDCLLPKSQKFGYQIMTSISCLWLRKELQSLEKKKKCPESEFSYLKNTLNS
jgi:hypothetical protein